MPRRRFFVLDERLPSSKIEHMLGRVVADKLLPLDKCAPIAPSSSTTTPRDDLEKIIRKLLPTPSETKNRRQTLEACTKKGLHLGLVGSILGTDLARTKEEKMRFKSELVRQYTLSNPDECFNQLMDNELYAQDVQKFLANTKRHRGYLITGFLTASQTLWNRTQVENHSKGFSVTLPVAEVLTAGSLPFLGALIDPTVAPSDSANMMLQGEEYVPDEEIFAVSYSLVKIKYRIDRKESYFTKKTPSVGAPKRANPRQLALSHRDEDEGDTLVDPANGDVFLVDIEEDEDDDENVRFLELELEE